MADQGMVAETEEDRGEPALWVRLEDKEEFIYTLLEIREKIHEMVENVVNTEEITVDKLRDAQVDLCSVTGLLLQAYQLSRTVMKYQPPTNLKMM